MHRNRSVSVFQWKIDITYRFPGGSTPRAGQVGLRGHRRARPHSSSADCLVLAGVLQNYLIPSCPIQQDQGLECNSNLETKGPSVCCPPSTSLLLVFRFDGDNRGYPTSFINHYTAQCTSHAALPRSITLGRRRAREVDRRAQPRIDGEA